MTLATQVGAKNISVEGDYTCNILKAREFSIGTGLFSEGIHPWKDMRKGQNLVFKFKFQSSDVITVFSESLTGRGGGYNSSVSFGFEDQGGYVNSIGGSQNVSISKDQYVSKGHGRSLHFAVTSPEHLSGFLVHNFALSNRALMWWVALDCSHNSGIAVNELLNKILE